MTAGKSASSSFLAGGSAASDDNDDDDTVRGEEEEFSRSGSVTFGPPSSLRSENRDGWALLRSVDFGQDKKLRSMRMPPEFKRAKSLIDVIRDVEDARHGGLESGPTERMGNREGSESEIEEPVATPVAATDDFLPVPSASLAVARDPTTKRPSVLKNSNQPGPVRRDSHSMSSNRKAPFKLSLLAQQYDLDGDGVLDEDERAMMDSDTATRTTKGMPGTSFSYAPVRKSGHSAKSETPTPARRNRLTVVSRQYDLDGDGELDEIEQAMRDRDTNADGQLDNREVHNIIQDQLKSQQDYGMYKRWAAALTVLVGILTLSNFGTSWASALLAKDTSADAESGTVKTKDSGETVGYQGMSHLIDIEELTEDEFHQRRLLVDAEMAEDPDHPDHAHRKLGKKKNNRCGCTEVAYDHGKVKKGDLVKLVEMCEGARTVQMRRKWTNGDIMDMVSSFDYDTICEPGTEIIRKGKKKKGGNKKNKNNKNKNEKNTKNEVVVFEEEIIEFRKKVKNEKTKSVSFSCRRGDCFSSGQSLHQGASHPCKIERDLKGASECDAGLACYDPDDHSARRGPGICARLREFARRDQVCDVTLGINACEANYGCYAADNRGIEFSAGTVRRGNCRRFSDFAGPGEVCDVGLGDGACTDGYSCLGANGREIRRGIGFCLPSSPRPSGIARFAGGGRPCNTDYGLDACGANYACYEENGNPFNVGRGQAICQFVGVNVRLGGVCNVSNNLGACANGLQCLGNNGRAIQGGFGVCTNVGAGRNGGGGGVVKSGGCSETGSCLPAGASWAVDCTYTCTCMSGTCMKNCVPGSDRWFCYQ